MKLSEIPSEQQLDERALRKAAQAAALSAALAGAPTGAAASDMDKDSVSDIAQRMHLVYPDLNEPPAAQKRLAKEIASHYRVSYDMVKEVVAAAYKHQKADFPKAKDILAVIGVESSFNPNAKSGLWYDPAVGLMQVRPGIWNIDPEHLEDIDNQIKIGTEILHKYFKKTGSAEDALQAYNLGITSFRRGGRNPNYVEKYNNVLAAID